MSFAIAARAELLKTKRTASVWLTVLGAAFIPALFFTAYLTKPEGSIQQLQATPWNIHFYWGWQALSTFLFPMYIILICSLIPQIEYKNNTWKQVYAAPQSIATVFFSKFLTIQLLLLLFFVLFNFFMISVGVFVNIIYPKFTFLHRSLHWSNLLKLNAKTYIATLGISAIQYVLSLRFKNFIAPIGIGLALLVGSIIAMQLQWKHVYKLPYVHPALTLQALHTQSRVVIENHEWNALICCAIFLLIGFLDLKFRSEKG